MPIGQRDDSREDDAEVIILYASLRHETGTAARPNCAPKASESDYRDIDFIRTEALKAVSSFLHSRS